ncbi:Integrator complex subunit 9 [Kickxella alabastrina]|uniref:Integrator complex subunit 9 n=1 Tax=Kickxella alabastrina TaxID=61397 RepID=A0ACC1IX60_9FUNG|nr:Integrator complex subunit 9 [Kickxella alabastrina]
MPSISVISFSPSERFHLVLCELDGTTFIVDCGWPAAEDMVDTLPSRGKQQEQNGGMEGPREALSTINWERVDFILISNYEQMRLLPYITEYTGFSGPVYATEPTKTYGRCVLEEGLAASMTGSSRGSGLYSQRDIVAAMERVTDVRHDEVTSPVPFVQVYTRSSGYCIGAGNWTVEYKGHRTAFISTSTFATCLHPQEWDGRTVSEAQVLVFCDAADPSDNEEPGYNVQVSQRLNQLCSMAISTLKQRGRVLLIGEPYGVTQDIVQLVAENITALNLPTPQFVFVSPVAERTLQYGNIMGEWLCESKQAMLYLPEYPFADKDLRQRGHLHFVRSLADLSQRALPQGPWFVVVPPHDIATIDHFVRQWQTDARNCSSADMVSGTGMSRFSVLLHDDDTAHAQRLVNRLQTAAAEVSYVPVARRFTPHAIEQCLAGAARSQHVLVPSHVYARLASFAAGFDFRMFEYERLQATTVDLDTDRHLPLDIQREVASRMRAAGKQHALVKGRLTLAAGKIRFDCTDKGEDEKKKESKESKPPLPPNAGAADTTASSDSLVLRQRDLAQWTPERLAGELADAGLNATVTDSQETQSIVRIIVPGGSATIRMHGGWSIECSSAAIQWIVMDSLRRLLK